MTFEAIGTHWQIDLYEALSPERESVLLSLIQQRIEVFDKTYSRFRPDSLITEISQKAGEYTLPDDGKELFDFYYEIYKITDGLVTPLIGQTLVDAGYDADYSLKQKKALQSPIKWQEAMEYDFPKLSIKIPVLLDVGGAGKGYLVDIIGELLEKDGITKYCIDAGGDIIHRNDMPIRIGLEHPNNTSQIIGIVKLQHKSICGSAGNRRTWKQWNHIINPKTLESAKDIIAVWVIADTTILADMLATCLFFVPATTLGKYPFEYLLVRDDFAIEQSRGFVLER